MPPIARLPRAKAFSEAFYRRRHCKKGAFASFHGLIMRNFLPDRVCMMDVSASDLLHGFLLKFCIETGDIKAALTPFIIVPD